MIVFVVLILAQEQGLEPPDTIVSDSANVVRYHAKTIVYELEKSLIILKDSSYITYKDISLLSDSAYYHVERNQLEAFGSCELRQMDDSIHGNYLRYNIENKKALMTNGTTQIEKGFLEGKNIYWVDENTVNAYYGTYTTCSDTPPHYYFYSPRMKVYLGDMVIARPIVLYIEGFPVAAAPFWFVPISSHRKSGLLPFRLGNSRVFGKYIRGFAYYLVLSDYADVTFQIDALEKKGVMPHIEGVWNFAPFSKGVVLSSYIKEDNTVRYSIEARNNSEYFLFGSSFNCDVKYVSDNTFQQEYTETTTLWLEKEISSEATLSRNIAGFKHILSYERREIFSDTTTTIYEKYPNYAITIPSRTLFSLISYSFSGHLNRNRSVTPQGTTGATGANLHTAPTLQQTMFNLLTISPRLNLDIAVFDKDTAGNTLPTRFGYACDISASTNFYRVFDIQLLGIRGVLHKILPQLAYTYTPDFNFAHIPAVDGIPQFAQRSSMSFGIDQILEAKIGAEEKKQTIAQLGLASGYNMLTDSLSSISFSLDLPYNPLPKPMTRWAVRLDGSVNPYSHDYTYTISHGMALTTDVVSSTVNQSYTKGGVYQVWFGGTLKPTHHWSISYGARYDWQSRKLVDYSFSLIRDLHCWEALFTFNQLGDAWRYDFKVRIKEIPDVEIGKGLLGYVLE